MTHPGLQAGQMHIQDDTISSELSVLDNIFPHTAILVVSVHIESLPISQEKHPPSHTQVSSALCNDPPSRC